MTCNLQNRTIFCRDNLDVLRGINSAAIDLIYLDPPFNKKKVFTAPLGTRAEGAAFADIFTEKTVRPEWLATIKSDCPAVHHFLAAVKNIESKRSYNFCYLAYMAVRLIECHRVLKTSGSIYLHCDPTMSHYLKLLMDCIFGEKNFRNEIVWAYRTGGVSKKWFGRKHDIILFYAASPRARFNPMKEVSYNRDNKPYRFKGVREFQDEEGKWFTMAAQRDVWEINAVGRSASERTGYPTQKPLALLKRIIEASSNEGDMVLDPFCGSATALIAAEILRRDWVGVDVSRQTLALLKQRLSNEVPHETGNPHFTRIPPKRSD